MWCDLFFFYGNCDHRDLHVLPHSSPTRRSSDLAGDDMEIGPISHCPHLPLPRRTRACPAASRAPAHCQRRRLERALYNRAARRKGWRDHRRPARPDRLSGRGRQLDGATAEIVQEMRSKGGYRGIPVPLAALKQRVGETVASGTPDPVQTRPIIDRLFPDSIAGRMGGQVISIDFGDVEYPVATSPVTTRPEGRRGGKER